uniref:Uncharacterized protein n=1 Tax=Strongyloides papillosus TaxID=174720 RepID=A0A0N5BJR9_STREA
MLFLKTILIFLIIFIYEVSVTGFSPFVYSIGITGKLRCSLRKANSHSALVMLSKNPHLNFETNPIAVSYFGYDRSFNLIGHFKNYKLWNKPSKGYGVPHVLKLHTLELAKLKARVLYARTPICKYADRGSITVYISEKPHLQKEKKPIAWTIAQYKSSFFLKGVVRRWKQPRLYVKIFHSCSKKLSPCEKMFMKTIPSQYIAPSRKVVSMFNLGTVELSSKSSMGETCQKRLSF